MKKIICRTLDRIAFLSGVAFMLFTSCQKDDAKTTYSGITLRASKEALTKASETQFMEGDKVGTFIVRYANASTPGAIGAGSYAANMKFQCDGAGRFLPDAPIQWYTVAEGESPKSDFYAYYPYNESLDLSKLDAVPFRVKLDQSTSSNHTASDFMWVRVLDQTPEVEGVPMVFKHVMARFVINVKANTGTLDPAKLVVKFKNVRTSLTWDLTTMQANNRDSIADIIPFKLASPASGYAASYAVILPPQVITSNLIEFTYDGGTSKYWKPFSSPDTSYDICYGKQHSLNVGLNL